MRNIILLILLLVTGCYYPVPIQPPVTPDIQPSIVYVQGLLDLHNLERSKKGVSLLVLDSKLTVVAQEHANWMAENQVMSHTGEGRSTVSHRVRNAGIEFGGVGENVACGQLTAEEVVQAWMNSLGHRLNILNKSYNKVGFGIATDKNGKKYWCTVFISH